MANLAPKEKQILEELFGMSGGYVLDFTNYSFSMFIEDAVNIDIYNGVGYTEPLSKARKLRQIWKREPDIIVGHLLDELLTYCENYKIRYDNLTEIDKSHIANMRAVAERLKGNSQQISLPKRSEYTLRSLHEDIAEALSKNKPELALDRLHTFSTKLIRQICHDNNISTTDQKGNKYPLHSLAGMLKKKYEQDAVFSSSFTVSAIQNCILLFDKYNDVRNNQSYAHDNNVLTGIEAEFVVRIMSEIVSFISKAESYRKKLNSENTTSSNDILF